MRDFDFQNPTRILFGRGQIENIAEHIPAEARILLVAGSGSIRNNGVLDQVRTALAGRALFEYWGVEPNPDIAVLLPALDIVRAESIDFILAVGGGSVIDGAKLIAAAARTAVDPWSILAKGARVTDALPLGVVLTLPATGSESNGAAAISNRESGQKLVFVSPLCFPRFAVLDPETTFSLPPRQVSNGIADAFVHVLEQYLTYPAGGVLSDRLAEALLITLKEQGPLALADPTNYEVRANLMWAASLALNGLIGQGVPQDWTTHHIGHELTALFGLDHARSLAVVLPAVLEARRQQKAEKLLQFGARVFGISDLGDTAERIDATIAQTIAFFESLGIPTRLSAYDITEAAIPQIVAKLKANRRLRMGERLDITPDAVGTILTLAL
ncbi:MAG TPA: iron-containing alcohol dehydrogenase [Polyangiaceae bacterium]|nr:iron-containing alcohol dehydrogenase [Polyangiaceae bacterium]